MAESKDVLVTGCSSGFGRLIALSLAGRGHRVFATVRDREGRAAGAAAELAAQGAGRITTVEMDVERDASVEAAIGALAADGACIDVVVNNAGLSAMGLSEGFTTDQALRLFQVNVLGAHRVNRAVLPLMKERRRGLLVHVSTGLARMVMPCFGLYAASKAALEMLAEAYRLELAPLGIESAIVEPGPYPTALGRNMLAPAEPARLAGYGELAELPARMNAGLAAMFEAAGAPDPRDVADAVVALVEAPAGKRPLRTIVGGGSGQALGELNAVAERLQAETLRAQGLGHLLEVVTRE
ncbi:SDR family oxidoreductase [Sorangium sp. So ce124]|uniref:SDR family oxidoreductase n=1 Tax=Sorangium sp. So ce124 TaxID=3133280 RepID=UPI003F632FCA